MSLIQEFKTFINRGNVIDLAVGVIIGGAFGGITKSIIDDLIMPPAGRVLGNVDFSNLYLPLTDAVKPGMSLAAARAAGPVIAYGNFLTVLINFLILAFIVFLLVQGVNKLKRREATKPQEPAALPPEVVVLTEIRDLLKGAQTHPGTPTTPSPIAPGRTTGPAV